MSVRIVVKLNGKSAESVRSYKWGSVEEVAEHPSGVLIWKASDELVASQQVDRLLSGFIASRILDR